MSNTLFLGLDPRNEAFYGIGKSFVHERGLYEVRLGALVHIWYPTGKRPEPRNLM